MRTYEVSIEVIVDYSMGEIFMIEFDADFSRSFSIDDIYNHIDDDIENILQYYEYYDEYDDYVEYNIFIKCP